MRQKLLITAILVFLALLPLVLKIDFLQNDDWVYNEMVTRFMQGDFRLHSYTGPTFLTQGVIAAGFAKIFGQTKLPVLTLLFSCVNLFIFMALVSEKFKKGLTTTLLIGGLYYFNPINIYLILGFMTGQYFMFFLLLSFYLFFKYEGNQKFSYLVWIWILTFVGLHARQVALTIPLSLGLFFFLSRKWKESAYNFGIFGVFYMYLEFIFPKSARMIEIPLQFHHLTDFDYTFAMVYGILLILTSLTIPLAFSALKGTKIKAKLVIPLLLAAFLIFWGSNKLFKPEEISWGEFPYFENTWERTGFYPRGVMGTKYYFKGNYDLYKYWDIVSKVTFSLVASYILVRLVQDKKFKKFVNPYSSFIITYIALLAITETFYDRYIFLLIPMTLLFLLSMEPKLGRIDKLFILGFVAFLAYYSYLFAVDYVLVNEYIWDKGNEIVLNEGVERKYIQGANAWKNEYRNIKRDYIYNFSFDSQAVNEDYNTLYNLVDKKKIDFPLNIFVEPYVYLYQLK